MVRVTPWRWAVLFITLVVLTSGRHLAWPLSVSILATLGIVVLVATWRDLQRSAPATIRDDVVWRGQRFPRPNHRRRSPSMRRAADIVVRLAPGAVLVLLALIQLLRAIGW
jgi:hypothetical protein